ncbi:senescence-specific cysteine protease SAG12-like [Castanea sativa]|uniref:senescence-specific cysteine protease SAG12-like n=1 Tax=Castanea sativa TaxID=21020 RepID=UPI003F65199D
MALMDQKQFISSLFLVLVWVFQVVMSTNLDDPNMSKRFEQWISKYGKVYQDAGDKESKFGIFRDNAYMVDYINGANRPYKLALNKFADQLSWEFRQNRYSILDRRVMDYQQRIENLVPSLRYENMTTLPASVDWRKNGVVTPVLYDTGNQCVKIKGFEYPAPSETSLMKAVANQPVGATIRTGGDFRFYSGGVYAGACGDLRDDAHYVTIVGYGTSDDGLDYWLIKNSWGIDWGEDGYMRFLRGMDDKEGLCLIAKEASYPIV